MLDKPFVYALFHIFCNCTILIHHYYPHYQSCYYNFSFVAFVKFFLLFSCSIAKLIMGWIVLARSRNSPRLAVLQGKFIMGKSMAKKIHRGKIHPIIIIFFHDFFEIIIIYFSKCLCTHILQYI